MAGEAVQYMHSFADSILAVDITRVPTFHSHLEGLWRISPYQLKDQVSCSHSVTNTCLVLGRNFEGV